MNRRTQTLVIENTLHRKTRHARKTCERHGHVHFYRSLVRRYAHFVVSGTLPMPAAVNGVKDAVRRAHAH